MVARSVNAAPAPLVPFYYLNNFQMVLQSLRNRYPDVLSAEEKQFMASFSSLPLNSRALFVRMMMRSGVLFRSSRLDYPEIGPAAEATVPLATAGLLNPSPKLSLLQVLALLTKSELKRHFRAALASLAMSATARKSEMIAALTSAFEGTQPFAGWCPNDPDCVYELTVAPLCKRLRLMFFGNFRQDWSEFVLADLGIFVYERVAISADSRAFSNRTQFDAFQRVFACRELLHGDAPMERILAALPPRIDAGGWLEDRRQKLLFQIARRCERQGETDTALGLYAGCSYPGAWARRIRIYERLQDWEAVASLCEEVLHDGYSNGYPNGHPEGSAAGLCEVERQQCERAARRLSRRLGRTEPRPRRPSIPEFELYMDKPADECTVECCVRDYLTQCERAAPAVQYVENGLINSLFGLLCWRAVFAPLPGAFFHDFHHAPADFSGAQFYCRRERQFTECFAQLESGEYEHTIRNTHAAKLGVQSPFVAWGLLSETLLDWALTCFPAAHLRRWFEWIVRDVRANRSGFPDLVQFWPAERRYRLIEVKGPGDRLQDNQRRLLEFCVAHDMPVSVCRVRWTMS